MPEILFCREGIDPVACLLRFKVRRESGAGIKNRMKKVSLKNIFPNNFKTGAPDTSIVKTSGKILLPFQTDCPSQVNLDCHRSSRSVDALDSSALETRTYLIIKVRQLSKIYVFP